MERGAQNLQSALRYFRAAIARDPSFARAHAGLSLAHNVLPLYVPGADSIALVEASAARAVALDSALADARVALASARELDLRFAEAEVHYGAALALEPDNVTAHHWYGFFLLYTGRVDDAIVHLNRATQLDPLAKSAGSALAFALMTARRFPEARAAARRVLATDSTFSIGLNALGMIQAFTGAPDSAVATLEHATGVHPDAPGLRAALLFAYAAADRWQDAARVRSQLHAHARSASEVDAAFADLVFGDREPMMRLLDSGRGRRLLYSEYGFGCHPFVDLLWSDPRYRTMMHELGVKRCAYAQPWPLPAAPGK
jgi:serine/threonine-protein kinase